MRKLCHAEPVVAGGSLVLLLTASLPVLSQAAPTPEQRCVATKLRAAGREARVHLICAKSRNPSACLARAAERRDKTFFAVETRNGCLTTGDSAEIGAEVETLVAFLLEMLRPGGFARAKCTNGQLTATALAITRLAQAYARDARKPDPARLLSELAAAEAKFNAAFARAVARGDCLSQAMAPDVYTVILQGILRLHGKLSPSCGDNVRASTEACDGFDTGMCSAGCLPDCTCAPAATCTCWTTASLDAEFPPSFFDEAGRGGVSCETGPTDWSVLTQDRCIWQNPFSGEAFLARAGVEVRRSGECYVYRDSDPQNTGSCSSGAIVFPIYLWPAQVTACIDALVASQVYQASCL